MTSPVESNFHAKCSKCGAWGVYQRGLCRCCDGKQPTKPKPTGGSEVSKKEPAKQRTVTEKRYLRYDFSTEEITQKGRDLAQVTREVTAL
jgi:hypothetical protein